MAFMCDFCGYRNSEIKEGGGTGEKAKPSPQSVLNVPEGQIFYDPNNNF